MATNVCINVVILIFSERMSAMCELSNEIFLFTQYSWFGTSLCTHWGNRHLWITSSPDRILDIGWSLWPLVSLLASTMVIGSIFLISQHRGYRRHRAVYEYRDDGYFLLYKQSTAFYSRQSYVLASFLSAQNIFQVPGNEVTNSQCLASFPIFIPQLTLLALQVMIAVEWGLGMGPVSVTWYDLTY